MKRFAALFLSVVICFLCACTSSDDARSAPDTERNAPPTLIAHAGGAVYGYRLTNSLEAINNAYANGFRHIELDFERTSDGEYVLIHDWESMSKRMLFESRVFSRQEFLQAESFMDLTLMDLNALLDWMDTHEDCYIVTDAKCGNQPFLQDLFDQAGELANRFIPQAYSYEEYAAAKAIGYESVILTLYRMPAPDHTELTEFALTQSPWAITIPDPYMDESLISSLSQNGICTYTHTVNDLSGFEQWRACGLHGIYTDYFYPDKWPD